MIKEKLSKNKVNKFKKPPVFTIPFFKKKLNLVEYIKQRKD
jgi:hypothetical protein